MIEFKPYVYRNFADNTITVYLKDTPSYHKYIDNDLSAILSNDTNEVIGFECTIPEDDRNGD